MTSKLNLFQSMVFFFAFSNKQFEEAQVKGTKYCDLGGNMIVPVKNAKDVVNGLTDITNQRVAAELSLYGKNAIIRRELFNHEVFITGDVADCVDVVSLYGITKEEVDAQYRHILKTEDVDM
jgi:hypothetical protein